MNELFAVQPETIRVPEPRPAEEPTVLRTLAEIAADSRREPENYLRDTVVPHGGE